MLSPAYDKGLRDEKGPKKMIFANLKLFFLSVLSTCQGEDGRRMKSHKKRTKSKKKSANTFAQNLAPVCGLLIFVGLVGYRNYLLSVHDSEAVMLHHFKRQSPIIMDTGKGFNKGTKVQIYTPTEKDKKLAEKKMKRRYDDRKKLLLGKCGGELESNWNDSMQLIAVPDKNFTVCVVQKAGSTSWHKLVYKLRTHGQPWEKSGHSLNREAAIDLPKRTKNILMRSGRVTRVITVRHPFARLISGWHNKFHKDFPKNGQFLRKVGSYAGRHTPEEDHVIAFQDLIEYLADNGLDDVDVHFRSIEQLCSPCQYPYEYIVRAETALDDLWYVLDRINTTMEGFNKHSVSTKPTENTANEIDEEAREQTPWETEIETIKLLFRTVPRDTIEKLISVYHNDFEKFGYTFDLDTNLIGDVID